MKGSDSEFAKFTVPTLKVFLKVCSERVWQQQEYVPHATGRPKKQNSTHSLILASQATMQRHFLSILHHLSPAILANTTVVALLLLPNSRFHCHFYTQHEPTPTQKSAPEEAAATLCDFLHKRSWPFVTSCTKDYKGVLNCPIQGGGGGRKEEQMTTTATAHPANPHHHVDVVGQATSVSSPPALLHAHHMLLLGQVLASRWTTCSQTSNHLSLNQARQPANKGQTICQ